MSEEREEPTEKQDHGDEDEQSQEEYEHNNTEEQKDIEPEQEASHAEEAMLDSSPYTRLEKALVSLTAMLQDMKDETNTKFANLMQMQRKQGKQLNEMAKQLNGMAKQQQEQVEEAKTQGQHILDLRADMKELTGCLDWQFEITARSRIASVFGANFAQRQMIESNEDIATLINNAGRYPFRMVFGNVSAARIEAECQSLGATGQEIFLSLIHTTRTTALQLEANLTGSIDVRESDKVVVTISVGEIKLALTPEANRKAYKQVLGIAGVFAKVLRALAPTSGPALDINIIGYIFYGKIRRMVLKHYTAYRALPRQLQTQLHVKQMEVRYYNISE